jgi:DNA polymerase-1
MRRPLLIVDGDSFAHRAYHALPKSIRRRGDKGAGAILGFANILLRFYETEKPRAVLIGWDTYDAPTYRNEALASYQSGRSFDDELIEQLDVLPDFAKSLRVCVGKEGRLRGRRFPGGRRCARGEAWRHSHCRERRPCSPCAQER